MQYSECLDDVVSYGEEFATNYFKNIKGFNSIDAAERFVDIMAAYPILGGSKEIYINVHPLLFKSIKSKYTRIYKKAHSK
ncbi:MAG TPA: hypothetical protein VFD03_06325 [Clostridia bacterium]|nr:hypothetical protein [Clostridia bacterium]